MNRWNKIAALSFCAAMVFIMAACGSFEQKMVRAASRMEKLESYHMDADVEMSLSMSLLGQTADMDMEILSASDINSEPLRVKTDMTLNMMDENMEVSSYLFAGEGGSFESYVSLDGGESWSFETIETEELKGLNLRRGSLDSLGFLRECAESFEEAGKETVNGSQATRYDGVIEGEDVGSAVQASGILDSLSEGMDLDLSEVMGSLSGKIPTSVWIDDKSGMLVRYDMDMTEVFHSVWDTMTQELMNEELEGIGSFGLTMTLDKLSLSATLSAFNEVGEITLPEAAKAA